MEGSSCHAEPVALRIVRVCTPLAVIHSALASHQAKELAAAVLLLLDPHMTERQLTVGLLATAYGCLGSLHEERRLARAYGSAYARYQQRVPFFLPAAPRVTRRRQVTGA